MCACKLNILNDYLCRKHDKIATVVWTELMCLKCYSIWHRPFFLWELHLIMDQSLSSRPSLCYSFAAHITFHFLHSWWKRHGKQCSWQKKYPHCICFLCFLCCCFKCDLTDGHCVSSSSSLTSDDPMQWLWNQNVQCCDLVCKGVTTSMEGGQVVLSVCSMRVERRENIVLYNVCVAVLGFLAWVKIHCVRKTIVMFCME